MKKLLIILAVLLFTVCAWADSALQVDFLLSGYNDPTTAKPLSGGKVYTFLDGTSTLSALWTDKDKVGTATNPVILDSAGKAEIYGDNIYKMVIYDSNDVLLETLNGLQYKTSFLQEKSLESDYGCDLPTALAAIGASSQTTLQVDCACIIADSTSVTITDNISIDVINGGSFDGVSGGGTETLNINGPLVSGRYRIFLEDISLSGISRYTAEWTGAIGDDSEDNTLPLQKIIDSLGSDPGYIDLSGGIFQSGKLTIADGQDITFDGKKTGTIKKKNALNDLLIQNADTTFISHFGLKDIIIDGNKAGQTVFSDNIDVFVDTAEIVGSEFKNCQGKSIKLSHVNTFANIDNNFFHDGAEHTGALNEGSEYLSIRTSATRSYTSGQIVNITDNLFKGFVPSVVGRGVGGVIASGNSALLELEGHRLTITGNTFIDVGQDETVHANKVSAINLYRRAGLSIISNNRIIGGQHKGIDVQGSANCIISNNIVRDSYTGELDAAIAVTSRDGDKLSIRCSILGNIIENWGGAAISAVYADDAPGDGLLVSGNYVKNVRQFVVIENMINDIKIDGNTFNESTLTTTSADEQAISILIDTQATPTGRNANVTLSNNTISNVGNDAVRLTRAIGSVVLNGNAMDDIGTTSFNLQNITGNVAISGNAINNVVSKFLSALACEGSINFSGNSLEDNNAAIRSIEFKDGTASTIVSTNLFTITPVGDLFNYDTQTGKNSIVGNIAPTGTTVRVAGGSVITVNASNAF